jgi:transposase-like protein
MGQVLHGSARTTEAVRRAIQHSQESLRALAKRYGINQKTVAKWKRRSSVSDQPMGPKEPRSSAPEVDAWGALANEKVCPTNLRRFHSGAATHNAAVTPGAYRRGPWPLRLAGSRASAKSRWAACATKSQTAHPS